MTGFRQTMIKVLLFAALCLLLFVMLYNTMSNVVEGDKNSYTARFTSASGLRPGDDVRIAGVKVGRVESVEVVDNDQAEVKFDLENDQKVFDSTRIALRYQNLLGQRYLSLTAGAQRGAEVKPTDPIPTSMTDPGFDLTALLNGFKPLFDTLNPGDINKFAENIIQVLQGQGPSIESLLQQTGTTAKFLADRDKAFTQVLNNLTPVLENLAQQSDEFDATVRQLTALMAGLSEERETIGQSIDTLGGLTEETSDLLEDIRPGVKADVDQLATTADILATNNKRVGRAVDQLPKIFEGLARAGSYYSALNIYFCNFAIDAGLGPVWIGGSDGPYSEVCR